MIVSYPALFYFEMNEGYDPAYSVIFPDFPDMAGTSGSDISDALENASDYLGILLADDIEEGHDIPKPSLISTLSLEQHKLLLDDPDFTWDYDKEKSFISMVNVDVAEYLGSKELVKKTLTIPKWADKLGQDLHLNFSKTLTEAIAEKKIS